MDKKEKTTTFLRALGFFSFFITALHKNFLTQHQIQFLEKICNRKTKSLILFIQINLNTISTIKKSFDEVDFKIILVFHL